MVKSGLFLHDLAVEQLEASPLIWKGKEIGLGGGGGVLRDDHERSDRASGWWKAGTEPSALLCSMGPGRTWPFRGSPGRGIDAPTMPQKPQARARDKKRLTKRLANWRKKHELSTPAPEPPKTATKG